MKKRFSWLLVFCFVLLILIVYIARGESYSFHNYNSEPWGLPYNSPFLPISPRPNHQLCYEDPLKDASWEQAASEVPVNSGIGYGVSAGDVEDAEVIGTHVFAVKASHEVKIGFHILYPGTSANTTPLPLRWYLILDEQPLKSMADSGDKFYTDVTLTPGDDVTINFTIPPLSEGIHDLIFLGIATNDQEASPSDYVPFYDYRITLLAGEDPRYSPRPYKEYPVYQKRSEVVSGPNLLLSLDGSLRFWNEPEKSLSVRPGASVNYYIVLGFAEAHRDDEGNIQQPDKQTFALLALLDYEPVDILPGTRVLYGVMPREYAYTQIASKISLPSLPGKYDLLIIRINNPGFPMCVMRSPKGELRLHDFLTLFRASMEVVDPND